jgi:hypothetical protein
VEKGCNILCLGFELPAGGMKSSFFWDMTPCSPLKINRLFGGTYRVHFQNRRKTKQKTKVKKVAAGFLPYLFFDHENGDDIFLRNVG